MEGEITNRLLNVLNEQDIQSLEILNEPEIVKYLSSRIPNLSEIISEEVQKAKERFRATK